MTGFAPLPASRSTFETPTAASTSGQAAGSGTTSKISSDFDTFLQMLTVQIQYQDPLNPVDSADYAVQLATFSSVEQQVLTNELLSGMQSSFQASGLADLGGWIGKDVRTAAPVFYDGSPVTLSPAPALGADSAVLVVKDAAGRVVSRETIPALDTPYQWFGADATGTPLPTGAYNVSLESLSGERLISTTAVEHYARVVEARATADGASLVLVGGMEVAVDAVTALRQPES